MTIKVRAIERNVSFQKGVEKFAFVLKTNLYSRLNEQKVISEAALRSGISRSNLAVAWAAIGDVVRAWATEGHSVAIPGLGSMRFGMRTSSVDDVEKVSTDLITSRRVVFYPSQEIRDEFAKTAINITCYDRNGKLIKQVNSADKSEVEDGHDPEDPTPDPVPGGKPSKGQGGSDQGSHSQGGKKKVNVAVLYDESLGSVSGVGEYDQGATVHLKATPAEGHKFIGWGDGVTEAERDVVLSDGQDVSLEASFE